MDVEVIDLTLDEDDEGYDDDTSSIYSLATLPTKRESHEFAELEELEQGTQTELEPAEDRNRPPPSESSERGEELEQEQEMQPGLDAESLAESHQVSLPTGRSGGFQELDDDLDQALLEEEEIQRAVAEQLEREQQEWEEYERQERLQRQQERQQAALEEVVRALDHEMDTAAAAATVSSPSASSPFNRRLFEDPVEADIGVSGDVPGTGSQGAGEEEQVLCNDGVLTARLIPRDGHCMYRACLHQRLPAAQRQQLPGDADVHQLRRDVARYMRDNRASLEHFFPSDNRSLDHSIDMVEDGGWGDGTSLHVVSSLWAVPIEVYMEYSSRMTYFPAGQGTIGTSPTPPPPALRLVYRCSPDADDQLVYNHYDSVVELQQDSQQRVEVDHGPEATAVEVPPCSTPSATPPRSGASSSAQSSRTPPRRRSSPASRSPRKRQCTAAASAGPSQSSQELVNPASPTPGVLAPGSPNAECLSASQPSTQPSTQESHESQDEATQVTVIERQQQQLLLDDDMEGLRATAFSPAPTLPKPQDALLSALSPVRCGLGMVPELTSEELTREWLFSQTEYADEEDVVSNALEALDELLAREEEDEEEVDPGRRDVATGVSTLFGECRSFDCIPSEVRVSDTSRNRSKNQPVTTRTVSTNVISNWGKLVGTFQVVDLM